MSHKTSLRPCTITNWRVDHENDSRNEGSLTRKTGKARKKNEHNITFNSITEEHHRNVSETSEKHDRNSRGNVTALSRKPSRKTLRKTSYKTSQETSPTRNTGTEHKNERQKSRNTKAHHEVHIYIYIYINLSKTQASREKTNLNSFRIFTPNSWRSPRMTNTPRRFSCRPATAILPPSRPCSIYTLSPPTNLPFGPPPPRAPGQTSPSSPNAAHLLHRCRPISGSRMK